MDPAKVLVADDDADVREAYAGILAEEGHDVRTAATGDELISRVRASRYDLVLVDLTSMGISGKDAEALLGSVGITLNKNAIPFDKESPFVTSGIRVGSAAITTRGFSEEEASLTGRLIARVIEAREDAATLDEVRATVRELIEAHPVYPDLD